MEVHDAQMLDYPSDVDVHMRTTYPSPKPWLFGEAVMEDDVEPLSVDAHGSTFPYSDSVEIEMDQVYEESTEYDMVDADRGLAVPPIDVEFVDAHHDTDTNLQSLPPPIPEMSSSHSAPELSYPTQEHTPVPLEQETGVSLHHQDPEGGVTDLPSAELGHAHPDEEPASIDRHEPTSSGYDLQPAISEPQTVEDFVQGDSHDSQPEPYDAPAEGSYDAEAEAEVEHVSANLLPTEETDDPSATSGFDGPAAGEAHADSGEGEASTSPQAAAAEEDHTCREALPGDHLDENDQFLEPVPAILLDIPSSSEQPEACLFDIPRFEGLGPADEDPTSSQEFLVLLQDQLSLFYEPISNVFAALRGEGRVSQIPEYQDGELIIDAYDLSLIVSEDDINARDVSLLDLHNLHLGMGIVGPFRIRLRCSPHRFITRYRALQQQVYMANSASTYGDDTLPHASEAYTNEQDESRPADGGFADVDARDKRSVADGNIAGVGEDHLDSNQYPHYSEDGDGVYPPEAADATDAHTQEVSGDTTNTPEAESGDVTSSIEEPADLGDDLDAGAVHGGVHSPNGGATEDTEYAEVVEPHEDDEVAGDEWEDSRVAELEDSTPADDADEALEDDDEETLSSHGEVDADNDADLSVNAELPADSFTDPGADAENGEEADADSSADADGEVDPDYASAGSRDLNEQTTGDVIVGEYAASKLTSEVPGHGGEHPDAEIVPTAQVEEQADYPATLEHGENDTSENNNDDDWELDNDADGDWDDTDGSVEVEPTQTSHKRRFEALDDADEPDDAPATVNRSPSADSKRARVV